MKRRDFLAASAVLSLFASSPALAAKKTTKKITYSKTHGKLNTKSASKPARKSSPPSPAASVISAAQSEPRSVISFADEPAALALPFDRPGRLAMANRGPDTNGSQWFVTTNENGAAFLNGKYVLFGEVLEGLADAQRLQSLDVDFFSKPKRGLTVAKAGLIE